MSLVRDLSWLTGLVYGDGYIDDRHLEVYNSSPSILTKCVKSMKRMGVETHKIKIDIFSENGNRNKWAKILQVPALNISLRKNTSPWKENYEKVRVRVSSKEKANLIKHVFEGIEHSKMIGKKGFVGGLFDAEGSVDMKSRIEFKQVYDKHGERIVRIVHKILSKDLNIICTSPKTKHDAEKIDIYFYVKDLEKFKSKIGFVDTCKKGKLLVVIKSYRTDTVPNEEDVMKVLRFRPSTFFELMSCIKAPYHRISRPLLKLREAGQVRAERRGRQILYSAVKL